MFSHLRNVLSQQSLVRRFTIVSFVLIVSGMLGIGWWVGEQIKAGVIKETASTTALYMDSFISPNLQELSQFDTLTPESIAALEDLLNHTDLGRQVVAFKVWRQDGLIIFSTTPALIGRIFPGEEEIKQAYQGQVVASITDLDADENVEERKNYSQLLQIYSPIRLTGSDKIISVAEFYQKVDSLNAEIASAQRRSWLVVAMGTLFIYLALVGFVRLTSNTIRRQQLELTAQVARLTDLIQQNGELNERVRRAAANATSLNEHFLRRISAELHDGPSQELALALMRFDLVMSRYENSALAGADSDYGEQMNAIQTSLQHANQEVRTIAAGLGLPQLDSLDLPECIARAVRSHERRTGTKVLFTPGDLPEETSLPVKITTYRVIQEALNNAYRHAGGLGQRVQASIQADTIYLEISDQGPGFDSGSPIDWDAHLGLAGMRERVESLGGRFRVESKFNHGTKVIALLPLQAAGENNNG